MISYEFEVAKVHLVRLNTGEDLYEGLTKFATDQGIWAGWINFLGAVRRTSLRVYDQLDREYHDFHIHEPLEILAGVGNISLLDGAPFLHVHAAFGDHRGHAFGGHVNVGTDVFACEARVMELAGEPPVREFDDCTALSLWGGTL